jgi:AraC-like DNA-binding protein
MDSSQGSVLVHKCSQTNIPAGQLAATMADCNFMACERHDYHEIALVLEGRNIIELQGCCHMLREKQICLIEKNTVHRTGWLRSDSCGSSLLWIVLADPMIRLHTTSYNPEERNIVFGADVHGAQDNLIREAISELELGKDGYLAAATKYLSAFLTLLLRRLMSEDAHTGNSWNKQIVREVQAYIQSHLDSKLSLREISNKVALSPNYLSILYKQVTGKNLSSYTLDIKMEEAKKLLDTTSLALSEIAEKLGYYDQFHFSKVFKEHTGFSPRSYRDKAE